jgi:peptidoglycan-N-acetylglucosamine deacetylase
VPPARVVLYVSTIGALALLARSVVLDPVPMPLAAGALGGYLAVILAGVLWLRLGMFADVVWRGPKDARGVALTFDDGPSLEHTPKVLALLDEAGVKATFFLIGRKAALHPEIVRDILARGHAVGLHGYLHDRLFSLRSATAVRTDLAQAMATVGDLAGAPVTLFRPPIGHTSPRIGSVVRELDLTVVGWSVRGLDGLRGAKPERVAARVVRGLADGAIVLLHDAAENDDFEPAGVKALPRILSAMRDKDLEGVRVDAWIDGSRAAHDRE